jgi:hypothetical protein
MYYRKRRFCSVCTGKLRRGRNAKYPVKYRVFRIFKAIAIIGHIALGNRCSIP